MSELQRQLLALLVMDLGYRAEPVYGETPLRHQCAWIMAVGGADPAQVEREIADMVEQQKGELEYMAERDAAQLARIEPQKGAGKL